MYNVTNKKYQKIKIFVNQHESVDVQPKETIMINVPNISEHMKDLQENGFIKIKKVEK